MGWTPRRDGSGSDQGSPSRPSRRRRTAVVAAGTDDDQPMTGVRPRGGGNNSDGRGERDDRPRDIRVRLGKRWSEIVGDIKGGAYTWAQFVEGLDPEELARGQLKDKAGTFSGRPPKMVPREFHLACQRELEQRFKVLFAKDVLSIAEQYLKMAQSTTLAEPVKAKMLQYAMERVFGGIPKDVTIRQEQPWEQMVVNVMGEAGDMELPNHLKRRYAGYAERQGGTEDDDE